MPARMVPGKSIVLDLDCTLICAVPIEQAPTVDTQSGYGRDGTADGHVQAGSMAIYLRPGVAEFLDWVFTEFTGVGVWTLGTTSWLSVVFDTVLTKYRHKFAFMWSRAEAELIDTVPYIGRRWEGKVKRLEMLYRFPALAKLGFSQSTCVHLDDCPENYCLNPANGMRIKPFYLHEGVSLEDFMQDQELSLVTRFLRDVVLPAVDVRLTDLKSWRLQVLRRQRAAKALYTVIPLHTTPWQPEPGCSAQQRSSSDDSMDLEVPCGGAGTGAPPAARDWSDDEEDGSDSEAAPSYLPAKDDLVECIYGLPAYSQHGSLSADCYATPSMAIETALRHSQSCAGHSPSMMHTSCTLSQDLSDFSVPPLSPCTSRSSQAPSSPSMRSDGPGSCDDLERGARDGGWGSPRGLPRSVDATGLVQDMAGMLVGGAGCWGAVLDPVFKWLTATTPVTRALTYRGPDSAAGACLDAQHSPFSVAVLTS